MAAAGVPVVPTAWLAPGDPNDWPDWPDLVVKPTVSAGAQDTARYGPDERDKARAHADRLLAAGRPVMVQPYLAGVDAAGESMLVHVGGGYSHGFRKEAILRSGEAAETDALFRPEQVAVREPTPAERAVAAQALAAVPGGAARLLFARVDLLPGDAGEPLVIELELTEPSLWLSSAPGAADRLAGAIRTTVRP
jgi:glutathione synthase/RimK-type ligase-like ATP-grasp enzyme